MHLDEQSGDDEEGPFTYRLWACCEKEWYRKLRPSESLEDWAWTPVCPICGGFDGSLFI